MPTDRLFLIVQRKKQKNKENVWCCGVPGCEYTDPDAESIEVHISSKHPAKCLSADLLWLNTRGEDVVPDHCACTFSREFHTQDGATVWVRVSAVILDCCVEHLIKDVGVGAVYALRDGSCDKQQEAQLVAALERSPAEKKAAFCVACGLSICSQCMGHKYFPNQIIEDKTPRTKNYTGFQVKADPPQRYFVCNDCAGDYERLKSAWIIRAWQKLLRALNDSPSWRMHTAMHLHQHDSLNAGRHIYTLEHINTDSSGSKCGRCRNCFNPHRAQGCKSIGTKYEEGKSVYQFAVDPDEKYTGDTDSEDDVNAVADGNTPSSITQTEPSSSHQAGPSSSKQAAPPSSKQAKARPSSSKQAGLSSNKQAGISSSKQAGLSSNKQAGLSSSKQAVPSASKQAAPTSGRTAQQSDGQVVNEILLGMKKMEMTLLLRTEGLETMQDNYKTRLQQEQSRRQELEAELKCVRRDLTSERASKEFIIADRNKLLLDKAVLTEKARLAEGVNNDTLQAVRDTSTVIVNRVGNAVTEKLGAGSMKEVVEQAVKEESALLLSQINKRLEKRLGEDLEELINRVKEVFEDAGMISHVYQIMARVVNTRLPKYLHTSDAGLAHLLQLVNESYEPEAGRVSGSEPAADSAPKAGLVSGSEPAADSAPKAGLVSGSEPAADSVPVPETGKKRKRSTTPEDVNMGEMIATAAMMSELSQQQA